MANNSLDRLSAKELTALENRLAKVIAAKSATERAEVRRKAEALVREAGLRVSDLFGKGRKGKVAPKYRNPKNPDETWTGRGRKPLWMVKAGGDPKRFLIE